MAAKKRKGKKKKSPAPPSFLLRLDKDVLVPKESQMDVGSGVKFFPQA